MKIVGLEISDAGILAAGSTPSGLIALEGDSLASPGYALSEKGMLCVGKEAEQQAHMFPRYAISTFWDQLNTESLKQPGFYGQNHSEIAFAHLAQIWSRLRRQGDMVIMAVPEYFTRKHLGLILGMANELSMPVKGFVPMALAASLNPEPGRTLVFLDMHLHRFTACLLGQGERLSQVECETLPGQGFHHLFDQLASRISRAFIQQTRFDPFHQASYEQELYNRLPETLQRLVSNASTSFQIRAGAHLHQISIDRELALDIIRPVCEKIAETIRELLNRHDQTDERLTLQMTHRAEAVFGFEEIKAKLPAARIITCDNGSAALGAVNLADEFSLPVDSQERVPLLSSRSWMTGKSSEDTKTAAPVEPDTPPTHLLYRSVAYPISSRQPLIVEKRHGATPLHLITRDDNEMLPQEYVSLQKQGDMVILANHQTDILSVDGNQVADTIRLKLGQQIKIGGMQETLTLIACKEDHET